MLIASVTLAQTQVDLKSQSRNVDFSGASAVKPVPVGTVLPATCAPGAMFFKSDALAGSNLYGCAAANTWSLEGGSIAGADFSDFQSTVTGPAVNMLSGRVNFSVNGLPAVSTLGPATITKTGGSDTGTFLIFADYNTGAPVLRCYFGPGITMSNYALSGLAGSTCLSGNAFPQFSIPLARVDVDTGAIQPPLDALAGSGISGIWVDAGGQCAFDLEYTWCGRNQASDLPIVAGVQFGGDQY
jgi:hypothetical protein